MALCIFALAAFGFAACGGDDDSATGEGQTPEEVVVAFHAAAQDGDAAAVCEVMTEASGAMGAELEETEDCESAFASSFSASSPDVPDIEVGEVTIDGSTATVVTTTNGTVTEMALSQEDGEWKIDLLGAEGEQADETTGDEGN